MYRAYLSTVAICSEAEADALSVTGVGGPLAHSCLLDAFDAQSGHGNIHALVATAIAWHPAGYALNVAYGVPYTPGFCAKPGLLCQWRFSYELMTPASPQARIATDCALSAVICHPQRPAIIAAGTANGGVLVWDLAADAEDALIGRSSTGTLDVGHQQSVQSMTWTYSAAEAQRHSDAALAYLLCTVGRCRSSTEPSLYTCAAHFTTRCQLRHARLSYNVRAAIMLTPAGSFLLPHVSIGCMPITPCYRSVAVAMPAQLALHICRDGRILLWRLHDCAVPLFGMRVADAVHQAPVPLMCAAFPQVAAGKGRDGPATRLAVRVTLHCARAVY